MGGVKSCACWLNYLKRIVDPQVAGSVSELVGSVYWVVSCRFVTVGAVSCEQVGL